MTNNTTQASYADQHLPNLQAMADIVADKRTDRTIAIDKETFLTQGRIEHLRTGQVASDFTKSEIYKGLKLCVANAKADGPASCVALPDTPNKAGVARLMTMFHTIASGKRVGMRINLLLHGLSAHRRTIRRNAKNAELELVKSAGQEWYAEGIKLADGSLRAFTDMMSAMKGWVRATYGNEWYADPVKKAQYLQEAVSKVEQA
ncbi:MAG: hypothetical protein VW270_19065 [Candidatus Poseidoniales archaeon]|jgi:hypothetical protein